MTKEEQMEQLVAEGEALFSKWKENLFKREQLLSEMFGDCKFDGHGTVKVHHDKAGWQIYCDSCPASTTFTETFAEAADYWRAMNSVAEELNSAKEKESGE